MTTEPGAAARALHDLLADVERRPDIPGAAAIHRVHRDGAANLADYLALRHHELRDLQTQLAHLGVSSLGRSEAHVRATVGAALRACAALAGEPLPAVDARAFDEGPDRLDANAASLLGPLPPERPVRIMVTLPSAAADDGGDLTARLIDAGMDCARINTAHDDAAAWLRMIANVRQAADAAGRSCTVLADLAGPKLRTGPLPDGPRAIRIQPVKDIIGRTERPGTAVLAPTGHEPPVDADLPVVPIDGDLLAGLSEGDEIVVEEARGRRRTIRVVDAAEHHAIVELTRTTWLATGAQLHRAATRHRPHASGVVGDLPPRPSALRLSPGDLLVLRADATPAPLPEAGAIARIGCTLPEAITALRPGHRVELDDGAIGGEVIDVDPDADQATIRITRAAPRGTKLRGEKGINLPDTRLDVTAISAADLDALDAVGPHIDIIGLSFVQHPDDVHDLHAALAARALDIGIVLKIETPAAFAHLPELLVAAMRTERVGVMVARGDLAVEAGFERTAELQEEILWACEAARVPAIWATQVLESLAKDNQLSRAEVTDAAMASRAECVMLNKGAHIAHAVRTLSDILGRMATHHQKKSSLLRQLQSW